MKSKLAQAIGLARMSRLHYREAMGMPKGSIGRKDRMAMSRDLALKMQFILGRLSPEAYGDYLASRLAC